MLCKQHTPADDGLLIGGRILVFVQLISVALTKNSSTF